MVPSFSKLDRVDLRGNEQLFINVRGFLAAAYFGLAHCFNNQIQFNPYFITDLNLQTLSQEVSFDLFLAKFKISYKLYIIFINIKIIMQSTTSFGGLSLTEIFEIQAIQTLLIKFWYLGLTSDCLIAKEDTAAFKAIRKAINFANCFTFEMPIKTYLNFADRIMKALGKLEPKQIFDVLLGHLKNNKILTISFELFGVAFLQLFGRTLELANSQIMTHILRQIYIELTVISKSGIAIMKTDKSLIKQIEIQTFFPNYKERLSEVSLQSKRPNLNPEHSPVDFTNSKQRSVSNSKNLKTLRGRLQSQAELNNSLREEPGQYPTGEIMKNKDKINLSCFMMGGFEIVDYSESINQLHRKLLTKILLNK